MRFRAWVRRSFASPSAVYGTILYSALIAVVSDAHTETLEVLLVSIFSLVVFWGAHVFAETVSRHGVIDGQEIRLGVSYHEALVSSSGMLYAAIFPSLALLLGVTHLVSNDAAASFALLVAMVVLGVLGYHAFAQRKSRMLIRILGAIGTALFGFVIILLNTFVH